LALSLAILAAAASPAAAAVVDVNVRGVEGELEDNILAVLDLQEIEGDEAEAGRIRLLHQRATEQIRTALQPFGYYDPQIEGRLEQDGEEFVATYDVTPGRPMKVVELDLELSGAGADDPAFREIVRDFPIRKGETLYHPDYEEGKSRFARYAAENGYLDAEFATAEIRVDLEEYVARVVLHFDTGEQFVYGDVMFQQDVLEEEFLSGYVPFEQGQPLDLSGMRRLQRSLSATPYFSSVEVRTRRDLAEGTAIPIEVTPAIEKPQRWEVGAGYGTDTGARGSLMFNYRRINDEGHYAKASARVSQIDEIYRVSYFIPGRRPAQELWTITGNWEDLNPEVSESEATSVGALYSRENVKGVNTYSLFYRRELFRVGVDEGTSRMLVPMVDLTRIRTDDRIYPRRGYRLNLVLRVADEAVASNVSFFSYRGRAQYVRAFGDRWRVLARAEIGGISTDEFRDLPPSIRFFAGGDNSVRGYGYRELGRRDEEGNVIGGEKMLANSIELEYRFLEKWAVAIFRDEGDAVESFQDPLEQGVGFGVRWLSPVGLVRADVAWAVSEPDDPVRFHLVVGPDL
jgi:translocation and assembly module TamA